MPNRPPKPEFLLAVLARFGGEGSAGPPASTMTMSSSPLVYCFERRRSGFSGLETESVGPTMSSSSSPRSMSRALLLPALRVLSDLLTPRILAAFSDISGNASSGGGETMP
jgi:hypothetical protein